MRKTSKMIFVIMFILTLFSCGNSSNKTDIEWLKGGTLHKSTVFEWKNATEKNKLATCADFIVNIKKANNEKYETIAQMKKDATILMECINEATKGDETNNMQVSEIAVSCYILLNSNQ